ncbi:YqgE/AlgH family protein [Alkalilacustris brevis]|uniref:YqgE/AlgH family protein n=1 Tax=Alkalilacustris brevis TaxID=2026338 RepID=UPI000E0CE61F|nr:YqgE/AlgH family protein [Alkalilacustris brevis]
MGASDSLDLSGKLLIAMPGMEDPRFARSVVFVCADSSEETLGLIVNKPAPGIAFSDLLEQLSISHVEGVTGPGVFIGGPVETGRGFVLHSSEYSSGPATLRVNDAFSMTATLDILEDIAKGRGPLRSMLMLGYAGWGGGQLANELLANGWLTCEAGTDLVFGSNHATKWERALHSLGVDAVKLSGRAGHA